MAIFLRLSYSPPWPVGLFKLVRDTDDSPPYPFEPILIRLRSLRPWAAQINQCAIHSWGLLLCIKYWSIAFRKITRLGCSDLDREPKEQVRVMIYSDF